VGQASPADHERLTAAVGDDAVRSKHGAAVWQLAMENIIRDEARAAMAAALREGTGVPTARIAFLVDAAIGAARKEFCSPALPVQVLEIAVASTPVAQCSGLWRLVESRRSALGAPPFVPVEAKSNPPSKVALLRLCNGLLGRLSSVHDAELCGRVLLFLAAALRLSERSGLNTAARFAEEPAVRDVRPADGSGDAAAWDKYERFWRLQDLAARPWAAVESVDAWRAAVADVDAVLSTVRPAVEEASDEEQPGQAAAASSSSSSASSTPLPSAAAGVVDDGVVNHLTAPSLLPLQLRDASFLRQTLLQAVIALNYAADPPTSRAPGPGVASRVAADAPKLLADAWALLARAGRSGPRVAALARELVATDGWWSSWKRAGCTAFTELEPDAAVPASGAALRPGAAAELVGAARARAQGRPAAPSRTCDWLEGGGSDDPFDPAHLAATPSEARDRSAMAHGSVLEACAERGPRLVPRLSKLLEQVKEALDPESFMFDVDGAPYRDQRWAWRAMRLLRRQDATSFEKISKEVEFPVVLAGLIGVPVPDRDAKAVEEAAARRKEASDRRKGVKGAAKAAKAEAPAPGGAADDAPAAAAEGREQGEGGGAEGAMESRRRRKRERERADEEGEATPGGGSAGGQGTPRDGGRRDDRRGGGKGAGWAADGRQGRGGPADAGRGGPAERGGSHGRGGGGDRGSFDGRGGGGGGRGGGAGGNHGGGGGHDDGSRGGDADGRKRARIQRFQR